jgi:hypothetical protein
MRDIRAVRVFRTIGSREPSSCRANKSCSRRSVLQQIWWICIVVLETDKRVQSGAAFSADVAACGRPSHSLVQEGLESANQQAAGKCQVLVGSQTFCEIMVPTKRPIFQLDMSWSFVARGMFVRILRGKCVRMYPYPSKHALGEISRSC